jgi:uncharacterized protein (TIGR02271 family)
MNSTESTTVVGVFDDHSTAQRAVNELKRMGFTEDQIGMISHKRSEEGTTDSGDDSYAGEGAAAGLATGAGLGALWGLGIVAGVLPAIGPAIAGGTLAAILSSAAAGAAAAGLAGALVGLGMSKEEAEYYEGEFKSGRTLVTVKAGGRNAEARSLLRRLGATDISDRGTRHAMPASAATTSRTASESALRQPSHQSEFAKGDACPTSGTSAHRTTGMGASAQHTGQLGKDTIKATEEKLDVGKEKVEAGQVNVRKEVHTEHKTIDVPVEREEVVIERRPGSGQPASGAMGGQQEINIPVREEEVHVEKTPVVKEEVAIGKRTVRENEKVGADLRKEEIKVEKQGDINVRDKR